MATSERQKGCKYCRRPADCPPGPIMTTNRFHNGGCPENDPSDPSVLAEWKEGYQYGFDDNYIEPYRYEYYSETFILGYISGQNEIDRLVDQAVERFYTLDE